MENNKSNLDKAIEAMHAEKEANLQNRKIIKLVTANLQKIHNSKKVNPVTD